MTERFAKLPGDLIEIVSELAPRALKLACVLAWYMDNEGRAWPKLGTIMHGTGLSRQHIQKARNDLAKYGLKWTRIPQKPTVYQWDIFAGLREPQGSLGLKSKGTLGLQSKGTLGFQVREPLGSLRIYEQMSMNKCQGTDPLREHQGSLKNLTKQKKDASHFQTASEATAEMHKILGSSSKVEK